MTDHHATWYVVADGKQARILQRREHGLAEVQAFDAAGHGDTHHDADTSVSHIHSPGVDPHVQAKQHFAKHVAKHINEAVEREGVRHLHLAAPAHVLHDIVGDLSKHAAAALQSKISKDLIHIGAGEMLSHFHHA